ncbi:MAG: AMP-binding protein, partial [Burkholderiales bacterium]
MNGADYLLGAAALARHGQRVALICGTELTSYSELAVRVRRGSGALAELGVEPGDRVMLLMRDTPDLAAAWLGCLWHGAVAIALNSQLDEEDYRFIRSDSGARLAIIEDVFAARLPRLVQALSREKRIAIAGRAPAGISSWDERVKDAPLASAPFAASSRDAAFWLYSSGTTGRPKGIIHTHKDVLPAGQILRDTIALAPGDKVIATSRMFFAYGLENGLLGPLSIGAASVLCADWSDIEQVCALVAEHRPTGFFSIPSFYRRLLALGEQALAPFRPVRYFFAAGEHLPESVVAQWRSAVSGEILSVYGMSETFCVAIVTPPGTSTGKHTGKPLTGVQIRLVALEGHPAEIGEPGVLWLRHPALALGYANRKEQTREQ